MDFIIMLICIYYIYYKHDPMVKHNDAVFEEWLNEQNNENDCAINK